MQNYQVRVTLDHLKSNFVNLPPNIVSFLHNGEILPQNVIVKMKYKSQVSKTQVINYVGWSGSSSGTNGSLVMDRELAKSLDIFSASYSVNVSLILTDIPEADSIEVEPSTVDDWEHIEANAKFLEENLMFQTRCVRLGQILIVYPNGGNSQFSKMKVVKIGSKELSTTSNHNNVYTKLTNKCEVIVAPKERLRPQTSTSTKSISSSKSTKANKQESLPSIILRGLTWPHKLFEDIPQKTCYEAYTNFDYSIHSLKGAEYVSVSVIRGPGSNTIPNQPSNQPSSQENQTNMNGTEPHDKSKDSKVPKLEENSKIVAKLINSPKCPENHVGLSKALAIALNIENSVGQMIVLQNANEPSKTPPSLIIHPYITYTASRDSLALNSATKKAKNEELLVNIQHEFYNNLRLNQTVLTQRMKLPIIPGCLPRGGLLELKKTDRWVLPFNIRIPMELGEELLRTESFIEKPNPDERIQEEDSQLVGMDCLIEDIQSTIEGGYTGFLVYGTSGSGKTEIVNVLSRKLKSKSVYIKSIVCDEYSSESFLNMKKVINDWISKCSWYSPSCLILDNLDCIMSCEVEHTDSTQSNQMTEYFITALNKVSKLRNVSVLMTAKSKESLNQLLFQCHLVKDSFGLKTPDKEMRGLILKSHIKNMNSSLDFDLLDIVSETEGFLPNDLKILIDRSYQQALFDNIQEMDKPTIINQSNFDNALKGYTPSNLRGVKLQKSSVSWSDIGGLKEAKSTLLETLEWPTRYAPIFKSCPLRLRSGILLYGYPGCGKTLLASAVAGQCGLNFISIKGPEILNKYIGASEQSVRELFERAQSAKPCILFFDEFDSIAPKRGHDSTGVTDRVVNQMLTQMDGAEGLDGVYVLAATSRPDLIDSALLRPGRLDKSVICDMPNLEDRLDIFKSTTRKMDLADDVDLMEIAKNTEGYSGADIQGLGNNAYLKGVHNKLNKDDSLIQSTNNDKKVLEFFQAGVEQSVISKPQDRAQMLKQIEQLLSSPTEALINDTSESTKGSGSQVVVSRDNFMESLKETKSSISVTEKKKLDKVYSQFISARDGNMPDGTPSNDIGGRTTLM